MNQALKHEQVAKQIFARVFGKARIESGRGDWRSLSEVDFFLIHEGIRYAVMLKGVNGPRIADVVGRVATAVLQIHKAHLPDQIRPLVAIVLPSFGAKLIDAVRDFLKLYASEISWCLIDAVRGALHMEIVSDDGQIRPLIWYAEQPLSEPMGSQTGSSRIFTDLNTWMLKILLLRNAPEKHWSGPRDEINNPTHLAKVAQVSVQTAHSFVKALADRDFARVTRGKGVHLVRTRSLLDLWINDEKQQPTVKTFVRSIFGSLEDWEELLLAKSGASFAIGGFEACRRHVALHAVPGDVPWVHIDGGVLELLNLWNLEFSGEPDAQMFFVKPRRSRSVFRGVSRQSGVPVVDILQAALDVASSPNRGLEQAEMIIDRVIKWVKE